MGSERKAGSAGFFHFCACSAARNLRRAASSSAFEKFEDAVQVGASDIHIEPDEKVLRIRQRIDGILHENILNEVRIAQALVLRLKLVAGLDISEKRLPQDGRFNMKVRGRDVDVRMSTMPVQYGESVVMRLLDQSSGIL